MKKIKYLVMDVDGTLTDGKIYMGNDGEIMKAFDIKDGYGIHDILIPLGITPVILTGRKSHALENRCKELGITERHQGIRDKVSKLKQVIDNLSLTAYIGDDINDLGAMKLIKENNGIVGCPADAIKEVVEIADFISEKSGGNGAVREFIDYIVSQ